MSIQSNLEAKLSFFSPSRRCPTAVFKQRKNSMIHDPHRMTRAALTARRLLVALFCARLLAAPVRTNDGVVLCPAGQRPDGQGRCVPVPWRGCTRGP